MPKEKATTPCKHCGYDLAGLSVTAPCPECGKLSRLIKGNPRKYDLYGRAPLEYLQLIRLAVWLMAIGALAATSAYIASWITGSPMLRLAAAIASAMYLVGVWVLTAPRKSPSLPEDITRLEFRRLRWINRGLQSLWLVSHSLAVMFLMGYGQVEATRIIIALTFTIAGFGLIPFAAQLSSFALWACDDQVASRLNATAWGLGLPAAWFGLLVLTGGAPSGLIGMIVLFFSLVMILAVMASVFVYIWACFALAETTNWAIKNWHEVEARDDRLRQKADAAKIARAEREKRRQAKTATAHNPGGVNHARRDADFDAAFAELSDTSDTPANNMLPANIHRIERRSDDDPIPLEPE